MRIRVPSLPTLFALSIGAAIVAHGDQTAAQEPADETTARPAIAVTQPSPALVTPDETVAGNTVVGPSFFDTHLQHFGQATTTVQSVRHDRGFGQKLQNAMRTLRDADSEDSKEGARTALRELLGEYFDADLKKRREELDRLKQRADETEALLETRESSRKDLIDLQIKSSTYAADGLSLFGNSQRVTSSQWPVAGSNPFAAVTPRMPSFAAATESVGLTSPAGLFEPQRHSEGHQDPRREAMVEVNKAWNTLVGVDWEDQTQKKQEAVDRLRQALEKYFDADMQHRRDELKKVRDGLTRMENGIQKREDAREDIIALQLEVSENEAVGLGFFSGQSAAVGSTWPIRHSPTFFGIPASPAISPHAQLPHAEPAVAVPTSPTPVTPPNVRVPLNR